MNGPYANYQDRFRALIEGLTELGWLESKPFPKAENKTENRILWRWLVQAGSGDYRHFGAKHHGAKHPVNMAPQGNHYVHY